MWAMLQAAGAVLSRFGAKYPAVKWAVIALVGLFAVEFVAERAIDLYAKLATVQANVTKTNAENKLEACKAKQGFYTMNDIMRGKFQQEHPECASSLGHPIIQAPEAMPAPAPVDPSPPCKKRHPITTQCLDNLPSTAGVGLNNPGAVDLNNLNPYAPPQGNKP